MTGVEPARFPAPKAGGLPFGPHLEKRNPPSELGGYLCLLIEMDFYFKHTQIPSHG